MNKTNLNSTEKHLYKINRGNLLTESENVCSKKIDRLNTNEIVDIFVEEDKKPQIAISEAKGQIVKAIDSISNRLANEGRLFYIGAGTSGRLAVLDAAECPPTFCTPPDLVQALIAGGYSSLLKSSEDVEDNDVISTKELQNRQFCNKDCLIGISAGGTTPYVLSALKYSKSISALTVFITCVPEDEVSFEVDIVIRLLTGPEVISGSTRLKAGTATKMALNIISSSVMIKLGKVYGNKMIDLSIKNNKLLDRSIRILCELLKINRMEAYTLLTQSDGSVKISCLMKVSGLSLDESRNLLKKNNYHLHKALDELGLEIDII